MRFTPASESEVRDSSNFPLLKAGEYDFEILEAEDQVSKSGNEMIMIRLNVMNSEGRGHHVFDYLVGTEGSQFKVRHFADSVGLLEMYESGEIDPEVLVGRTGRCKIKVTPAKDGYDAKNSVADYVRTAGHSARGDRDPVSAGSAARQKADDLDDGIPF